MFELSIKTHFSAAHRLPMYPGCCANAHGHNWDVEVCVRGDRLDDQGMLIDFRQLRRYVADTLEPLDHCDLNTLPEFATTPPTSENIARYVFERVSEKLITTACRAHRVTVWETHGAAASYQA